MAPTKVGLEYIANNSTRKTACKKRTMGVMKKAGELSTLCGVEVCCMVLPEGEPSSEMQTWPSLPEAMAMVDRLEAMPEVDRRRKEMDGADYVRERIGKAKEQLCRAERENRQRETTLRIHDAMVGLRPNLDGLTVEQLTSIGWTTENLIKKMKDSIAFRGGQQQAGVTADPLSMVADVEARRVQRGWVMEVVKAGWDNDAAACSGGSGSYSSVSAGGDVMQLGKTTVDGGLAWAVPGTYFPGV
ncbi:hypothetical protein QYE76_035658 [Lolium multiflorum]|uniref:MADS-box domain-containing protein n=1 Tax=Lolium multiflorum TaxID=4521 RepID=A0AAD8QZH6_LOLMU|nr:hypothetical protein QYE76_035658 [Lolium multiflorum]